MIFLGITVLNHTSSGISPSYRPFEIEPGPTGFRSQQTKSSTGLGPELQRPWSWLKPDLSGWITSTLLLDEHNAFWGVYRERWPHRYDGPSPQTVRVLKVSTKTLNMIQYSGQISLQSTACICALGRVPVRTRAAAVEVSGASSRAALCRPSQNSLIYG